MIEAVDLAAKFSALCIIDRTGRILDQNHSWAKSEEEWVDTIVAPFYDPLPQGMPDILIVEDLPHGVGYKKIVKQVCRLQGRICHAMEAAGVQDRLIFIPPQLWQLTYEGVARGAEKDRLTAAERAASEMDYVPPDLLHKDLHGADRVAARKTKTDYVAAYLIARWTLNKMIESNWSLEELLRSQTRLDKYGS